MYIQIYNNLANNVIKRLLAFYQVLKYDSYCVNLYNFYI